MFSSPLGERKLYVVTVSHRQDHMAIKLLNDWHVFNSRVRATLSN